MSKPVHYHTGKFPPQSLDWARLIPLLSPTAAAIARFDGVLAAIPNADVLLSPLTTQEAVLSSRIEGTQATMGEVLQFEAKASHSGLTPERREDIYEVLNYRKAMRFAEQSLQNLPMSLRLIKDVHVILLSGVRGQRRAPGEFRRIPNWIGPHGCGLDNARFVPISADKLDTSLGRWESYIHEETPDRLVQLALIHAEFEALHPFLDGNGRLGRILLPLILWQYGLIQKPIFYLSGYLEANRDEYYDRLLAISRDGDWAGWCRFFLEGLRLQAEDNLNKANAILELYEGLKAQVQPRTRSQYGILGMDWIFSQPLFRSTDFYCNAGIPEPTARRILKQFAKHKLVKVLTAGSGRRPTVYSFPKLLNIAEGEEVF